jgi:hypothetical protein
MWNPNPWWKIFSRCQATEFFSGALYTAAASLDVAPSLPSSLMPHRCRLLPWCNSPGLPCPPAWPCPCRQPLTLAPMLSTTQPYRVGAATPTFHHAGAASWHRQPHRLQLTKVPPPHFCESTDFILGTCLIAVASLFIVEKIMIQWSPLPWPHWFLFIVEKIMIQWSPLP